MPHLDCPQAGFSFALIMSRSGALNTSFHLTKDKAGKQCALLWALYNNLRVSWSNKTRRETFLKRVIRYASKAFPK